MKTILFALFALCAACNNRKIEHPVRIELYENDYYTVIADTNDPYCGETLFVSPDLNDNVKDCLEFGYTIVEIVDVTCE